MFRELGAEQANRHAKEPCCEKLEVGKCFSYRCPELREECNLQRIFAKGNKNDSLTGKNSAKHAVQSLLPPPCAGFEAQSEPCYGLKKLNVTPHFFRFKDFPNQDQRLNDLAYTPGILAAVSDAAMGRACCVQSKKVMILCEKNTMLRKAESNLLFVARAD